jgi:hypothetical protein
LKVVNEYFLHHVLFMTSRQKQCAFPLLHGKAVARQLHILHDSCISTHEGRHFGFLNEIG